MLVHASTKDPLKLKTHAIVIGCFQDGDNELFAMYDAALGGFLRKLVSSREFEGKPDSCRLVHTLGKLPAERILLVGLGKKAGLDDNRLRQAAGTALQALRSAHIPEFTIALHLVSDSKGALKAVCEGALLGSYSFDEYKTKGTDERFHFTGMNVLLPKGANLKTAESVLDKATALWSGVRLARDLVSHPGNIATTGYLAAAARSIAKRHSLTCKVLERDDLVKLGMNALLAVGKGSAEPPRMIIIEYHGSGKKKKPVVLVGKGITFDSGGISIKPGAGMEEMKTDMAGAAAVLGTIEAAAGLGLPVNIVGIIPAAENMPDGLAYRPGDVLTSMSGQTIEITNTDAEGRLILCDALHYGSTRYKPAEMIDLATLTGACVVALGHEASGLMANNQLLADSLVKAGESTGERVWQLPLWDEYGQILKSDIADFKNAGSRDGGSITAGWFLKQFVGDTNWAHLDIAGTAWTDKPRPCSPKGASGVGVRLLIEFLESR